MKKKKHTKKAQMEGAYWQGPPERGSVACPEFVFKRSLQRRAGSEMA